MYLQLFILERGKCGTIVKYNSNEHLHTETRHEQGQSAIKKGNAAYKVHLQTLNLSLANSQSTPVATTPVDHIREPTSCTLVFLSSRQNTVMEVATDVAHPPGGLHHNNKIPLDYTRVEVHTVKPEFMQWLIDYATPEGLVFPETLWGSSSSGTNGTLY